MEDNEQNAATRVFSTGVLFHLIREFYGLNSFLYLAFTKGIKIEHWGKRSGKEVECDEVECDEVEGDEVEGDEANPNSKPKPKYFTSKHLVTKSKKRILEVVEDPRIKGNRLLTECIRNSARRGDVSDVALALQYCRRKRLRLSSFRVVNIMDAAARSGSIKMLEHLQKEVPIGKSTLIEGIRSNNCRQVIEWLLDRKCEVDENVEEEAAKIGNIEALKTLRERPFFPGFSQNVMIFAAASGCTKVIDFLMEEEGCSLTSDVMCMAAFSGHLNVVRYLRSKQCAWDKRVCWMAAFHGHLEIIKWARTQQPDPCPWCELTVKVAIFTGQKDVVSYYKSNTPKSR